MTALTHRELVDSLIARWPESHPEPSLERIAKLCELLGDPQESAPIIQITGTNGKGSTAIMVDALVRALGLRTGRFSSPHLNDVTERICIDGEPISPERFDEIWEQIEPMVQMVDEMALGGVPMTFFEIITGMAYAAFADAPVDVMVMEVGMGGEWDATSVGDAAVAVIAPVALDHQHILGDTIEEIAATKAGIIKPSTSAAVFAGQTPEAAQVLMERCTQLGVRMVREGVDFGLLDRQPAVGGQLLRVQTASGPMGDLYLPLFGSHMAHNAALAIAAVEALRGGHEIAPEVIADGLAAVAAPARLEVISRQPTIVLDTAHNPAGVTATLTGFREAVDPEKLILVTAMMRDKAVDEVLELLAAEAESIIVTTLPGNERALSVEEIAGKATDAFGPDRVQAAADPAAAMIMATQLADQVGDGAAILVVGSVYLAGAVRPIFVGKDTSESGVSVAVDKTPLDVLDGNVDQWN